MIIGALLDLGLSFDELTAALSGLPVHGYRLEAERVRRCGISATCFKVHAEEQHHHRGLSQICGMINESSLPESVKQRSTQAFQRLAEAEAAVHETDIEKVHFHELGGIDTIIDITGAMWGAERLGIDHAICSEVALGSGTVKTMHGEMPVPAPATARLLQGVPVRTGPLPGELATPTGAVILTTLSPEFREARSFRCSRIGYGAGTREYKGHTNYLRIMLGEADGSDLPVESRSLLVLQTEVDDMPAEQIGFLMERLFTAGCLDAHFTPVQMKKNRPGTSIQVLCPPELRDGILELLLRETSTFGVKILECQRCCLRRDFLEVVLPFGRVSVKRGYWGDEMLKATPEFEDCRRIALEKGIPLSEVFAAVNAAIHQGRYQK